MNIGMDVTILRHGVRGGTAVYAFNLARALAHHSAVDRLVVRMAAREDREGTHALERLRNAGADVVRGSPPDRWSPDAAWWLPWPRPLPHLLRSLDVYHAGEFYFPDPCPVPTVATVHDLTDRLFPELHTRLNRWMHRRRMEWIGAHADRIITVSEATRSDLLDHTDVGGERTVTVHEARGHPEVEPPSEEETRAALGRLGLGPDHRCILYVSTLEPRKNHARLVRAFESLPERHRAARLVLVGGSGWGTREILRSIEDSPARQRIVLAGHVSDSDLRALYASATVFAYPSLYEGFGLPLLEAMAAGAPVLTSNRSSMPEVVGGAGILVDPESVESIADGLSRLLGDDGLRRRLANAGRRRETGFSWHRTAEATLDVYREAMAAYASDDYRGEGSSQ